MTLDDGEADVEPISLSDLVEQEVENINDKVGLKLADMSNDIDSEALSVNDLDQYQIWLKKKAYESLSKQFSVYNNKIIPIKSDSHHIPAFMKYFRHISDDVVRTSIDYYKDTITYLQVTENYRKQQCQEVLDHIRQNKKDTPVNPEYLNKISEHSLKDKISKNVED